MKYKIKSKKIKKYILNTLRKAVNNMPIDFINDINLDEYNIMDKLQINQDIRKGTIK